MENSVAIATELTVTALREYTYGLPPGTLLDQFEALLSGLINGKIAIKDLEKADNDAASIEQDKQDNMKPCWLHGVDNLPGFVAKKKHTEKNEAYYTEIMIRALKNYEDDWDENFEEILEPRDSGAYERYVNAIQGLKSKLISGEVVLVEDTDFSPSDDIGYNEQDGIAGNICSIQKKEETVAVENIKDFASETCGHKLVKETKLIKQLLHSYELLYSNNLSEKRVNEVRELSKKLFNGDIILVENEDQDLDMEGKDVAAFIAEQESLQGLNLVGDEIGMPVVGSSKNARYSAFWKRLRRVKRQRKSKSIVKVITETTIEEFETQLTKHANGGYKIKYVNIDTKAGNSGSGVRYYAVVERSS